MMEFVFDIFETTGHFRRFPLRKMQCLFLTVGKERIILDMVFQRGAEQQIGMECQKIAFVGKRIVFAHTENLAGSKKHHRCIRIIVIFAPATIAFVFTVFNQQDSIKFEPYSILFQIWILQIDNTYLRMQRLAPQTPIAFAYGLNIQRFFFHRPKKSLICCFMPIFIRPPIVQINHTDQRTQRFKATQFAIQVRTIPIDYLIHKRKHLTYRVKQ